MPTYYLAIDIGASSGRHILGWIEDGTLRIREMYRFPNGMLHKNGTLIWDTDALFRHILQGLAVCRDEGMIPSYLGIDTWGVDYVLLDRGGGRLGEAVGYRDSRTEGADREVAALIGDEALYAETGIQKQPFNTIYQLWALKKRSPELLREADRFLMIPEYFNYLLTGKQAAEYTNATTTQLLHAGTRDWDRRLLRLLAIPEKLFLPVTMPGVRLGSLLPQWKEELGFDCTVMLPATHDTGSAVLAVPAWEEHAAYISSGTWSLLGTERKKPDTSEKSRLHNFTNEGGFGGSIRFLKNITGLWIIQSMKKELEEMGRRYTFDALCDMAVKEPTSLRIPVNDPAFLAPESMIRAVEHACGQQNMTVGALFSVVYQSLADNYGACIRELEQLCGTPVGVLHIVGGGSRDSYLNRLTADACGKPVYAGPSEATAIGNLLAQMLTCGVFSCVKEAREAVRKAFPLQYFLPGEGEAHTV